MHTLIMVVSATTHILCHGGEVLFNGHVDELACWSSLTIACVMVSYENRLTVPQADRPYAYKMYVDAQVKACTVSIEVGDPRATAGEIR